MDLKLIKSKDIQELKQELQNIRNSNAEMNDEWLNTEETTKFLKVTKRTLKRYRDSGKLPYSQDDRIVRFRKSDLIKYLNRHYHSTEKIA